MNSINFKLLFLALLLIFFPSSVIYYYYYNYLAKPEPVILKLDNTEYKIKPKAPIKKFEEDNLIYKSRTNSFEEHNFKIVDDYENLKKENLIELQTIKINPEKLDSIFDVEKTIIDSDIKIILKNSNYKNKIYNSKKAGAYYIELGTFSSKEQADSIIKEMKYNNKKSLDVASFEFKFLNYRNKIFIKLIIPYINSFNEARQLCKIVKESQNSYCLIKNY
jgi:hypothetical protein